MTNEDQQEDAASYRPRVANIPGVGDYLQAAERVRWFRSDHPEADMRVEILHLDPELGYAAVKGIVDIPGGGHAEHFGSATRKVLQATALRRKGTRNISDEQATEIAEDYLEFASTAAYSRALALMGYGTLDALDVEHEKPADSPQQRPQQRPQMQENQGNQTSAAYPSINAAASSGPPISEKQLRFIYSMGKRDLGMSEQQIDELCLKGFKHYPNQLTTREASAFIDSLKASVPA